MPGRFGDRPVRRPELAVGSQVEQPPHHRQVGGATPAVMSPQSKTAARRPPLTRMLRGCRSPCNQTRLRAGEAATPASITREAAAVSKRSAAVHWLCFDAQTARRRSASGTPRSRLCGASSGADSRSDLCSRALGDLVQRVWPTPGDHRISNLVHDASVGGWAEPFGRAPWARSGRHLTGGPRPGTVAHDPQPCMSTVPCA